MEKIDFILASFLFCAKLLSLFLHCIIFSGMKRMTCVDIVFYMAYSVLKADNEFDFEHYFLVNKTKKQ